MNLPWNKPTYEVNRYPDGSKYVEVKEFTPHIIFRINNYQDLWLLTQLKDVYDHNRMPLSITIPCLLDAQADRRFGDNQPNGLRLILEHLKSLNFKEITIFHPHNPEVVEAILPNVKILDNSHFIQQVLYTEIAEGPGAPDTKHLNNLILMSSDAGGFKPLIKLADKLQWKGETYSASKSRSAEIPGLLHQQVDRQDFGGKDILIIDDICVKGGTFVGLAKILRERNVGKLLLAVSHMTILDFNPELTSIFDTVFTTNSKGWNYRSYSAAGADLRVLNYGSKEF